MIRNPGEGHFWQVDHIKPVSGGGGQCSDNLQTLCTACHREVSDACRHIWLHTKTANWKLCIQVWRTIRWIYMVWDLRRVCSFHYLPLEFFLEVYTSSQSQMKKKLELSFWFILGPGNFHHYLEENEYNLHIAQFWEDPDPHTRSSVNWDSGICLHLQLNISWNIWEHE